MQDRECDVFDGGLMPYNQAWQWQRNRLEERRHNGDLGDVVLLVEHPPVYTLGKGSTTDHLKFNPDNAPYPVVRIERGGEVTHHAPGQLVGYPILNLKRHTPDLHWYLRQLEEVIILTLTELGLQGTRLEGLTGVWVDGEKVAAIGIKVSRWITMHGFALNVCPSLDGFRHIVPCGIGDRPVASLEQWIPGITVEDVKPIVVRFFGQTFGLKCKNAGLPTP
ncbi:MAG: lipoyl(octanoyl) transferase LipB [Cyanophyceae cyanobacterium]